MKKRYESIAVGTDYLSHRSRHTQVPVPATSLLGGRRWFSFMKAII